MLKEIKDILNKQLLRQKPTSEQFSMFLEALRNLQDSLTADEGEEHKEPQAICGDCRLPVLSSPCEGRTDSPEDHRCGGKPDE